MTILPKKKSSQSKNQQNSNNVNDVVGVGSVGVDSSGSGLESTIQHQVHHHQNVVVSNQMQGTMDQHGRYVVGTSSMGGGRTSPPSSSARWHGSSHTSGPGDSTIMMDDGVVVGSGTGGGVGGVVGGPGGALIGPVGPNSSIQHKRRHRASPHRNVRKHREHRSVGGAMGNNGGGVGGSLGGGGGVGGPSTSSNATLNGVAGGSSSGAGTSATKNNDDDDMTEDFSGYNSGDEYCQPHMSSEEEWAEAKNSDYFSQYVTEDFDGYLNRKRLNHIHGNHVEIQALCEMYNRSIEVFSYSTDPINTFHGIQSTDNESIRISYHKNSHYNSIVDPYKATVGVGLGLPGFMPGLAEKNLMHDAVQQSEDFHIEQTMLEDKLKATDWEATNEAIEEQVARESYLQWLRDNERRARKATTRSATATCSSSGGGGGASPDIRSPTGGRSPRGRPTSTPPSAGNSPSRDEGGSCNVEGVAIGGASGPSNLTSDGSHQSGSDGAEKGVGSVTDFCLLETASFINQLPPDVFGLSEWEDADILAQVLAASQQEYLDRLKRSAAEGRESSSSSSFSKAASSSSVSTTSSWQEMDMKTAIDANENHKAMDS